MAMQVDARRRVLVLLTLCRFHARKIRLQTAQFCDQPVNCQARYQDLHPRRRRRWCDARASLTSSQRALDQVDPAGRTRGPLSAGALGSPLSPGRRLSRSRDERPAAGFSGGRIRPPAQEWAN
jgi:hypothetical protein